MGADWPPTWRARRIHQLLDAKQSQSVADFEAMQRDDVSLFARDLLPIYKTLPHQTGSTGLAQDLLARWDGTMAADLPQPLIFNAAIQLFVSQVITANHVTERDIGPWDGFAAWLLTTEGGSWCNGDCRPALGRALHDSVEDLAKTYGNDPALWRWGDVHKAEFSHPLLGDVPVIDQLAARSVTVPGDNSTLFRGGNGVLGEFASLHGAGYRGVYDLADLDRSRFIVTPGQSGNLFSSHAWDLLKLWAMGATITIPPSPDSVDARISLAP
jgi:penicillin amidase